MATYLFLLNNRITDLLFAKEINRISFTQNTIRIFDHTHYYQMTTDSANQLLGIISEITNNHVTNGRLDWEKSRNLLLKHGYSDRTINEILLKIDDEQTELEGYKIEKKSALYLLLFGSGITLTAILISRITSRQMPGGFAISVGLPIIGLSMILRGIFNLRGNQQCMEALIKRREIWVHKFIPQSSN